jgi:uncharacterized protein YodC (DUF2158 family)
VANKYNTGDLVRLKSGGPPMTVNAYEHQWNPEVEGPPAMYCMWFAEDILQCSRFTEACVESVSAFDTD